MNNTKTILICPLDWGLGHAARCVPIINELLQSGYEVIIGADKNPLAFLKLEFPQLKTVTIPGYEVNYDEKGSSFQLFCESIKFYKYIKQEHSLIDNIIEDNNIDIIISDNRYGLWSKKVQSILITHQLYIKTPFASDIAHKKIEKLIINFDETWIPDFAEQDNLSGDLSHLKPFKPPHQFIGPLSRFSAKEFVTSSVFEERKNVSRSEQLHNYDFIAILSGPEPQRTVFENMLIEQIKDSNLKAVLVRGLPDCTLRLRSRGNDDQLTIFNHLPTNELYQYIQQSEVVVCRAGYSSIMDLAALNKKAILVPTPKQTEQEYLAQYHQQQGNFYSQQQSEFDLEKGMKEVEDFTPKFRFDKQLELDIDTKKL